MRRILRKIADCKDDDLGYAFVCSDSVLYVQKLCCQAVQV